LDLAARLAAVRIWLFDVDGVLTDGRLIFDNDGKELKCFDVRDGHGLALLRRAGIRIGFITGRESKLVARRAEELGCDWVVQGSRDKWAALENIMEDAGVSLGEVGYMGDDVIDLPVLARVGFACAPADAHRDVLERVHYVTQAAGGRGAAREAAELLLRERGLWAPMIKELVHV
jgi:3-deoxy-D-manno-octulosonate 8-phosphate phosphatase (KDO 8-P phosphatase)